MRDDPILAECYGGVERYQELLAQDAFYRPEAFSNLPFSEQWKYALGRVTTAIGIGTATLWGIEFLNRLVEKEPGLTSSLIIGALSMGGAALGNSLVEDIRNDNRYPTIAEAA